MCSKKPLFYILAVFLSLTSMGVMAQFKVTGKVSGLDGEALEGVSVKIKGRQTGTHTDSKGAYELALSKAGSYILEFSSIGYTRIEETVSATSAQPVVTLEVVLTASSVNMDEVTVHGKTETQQLREQAFAVSAIDARKLANTTADLGQVLNRSTGIKIREQGGMGSDFEFSINGLSGKSIKFFLDGIPLEIMGSAMNLNNIPINLAERIEVYKGVAPVELGSDALGGAVNIVTNKSLSNYLDVSHSYGSFQTHQGAITGQWVKPSLGLVLKGSSFFNYSLNNYLMREVEVRDFENNEFVITNARRFHDRYRSWMGQAEIGLVNKKWADVLFLGFSYTTYDKQVQTGVRQSIVYGAVTRNGTGRNLSVRYKKDGLVNGHLDVNLYATYSRDEYALADTTLRKYYWDGQYIEGNPETGSYRITQVTRPRYFTRLNANYHLAENHDLNVNYTFDQVTNETYNSLVATEDDVPGRLSKHLVGLAYQQKFWDRLTNTFMGKFYGVATDKKQYDLSLARYVPMHSFKPYVGYGLASVYKIDKNSGIKASYEHTYRLQDVNEVFGDGYQVINNLELNPESSDNLNLGGFYGRQKGSHNVYAEASTFLRKAEGFIYANQYSNNQIKYENLSNVLIRGADAEVRYNDRSGFSAMLNVTYQNALDNTRFVNNSGSGTVSATYRKKVPNQPWMFGNLDLGWGRSNVWQKASRLQVNWSTNYTHWYYRSWEGFATTNSLEIIPKQLIHNLMLAYSLENGRYNLSLEAKNLTNQLAFDNFRLQRPGRALFVKFRYFLK